MDFDVHHYHHNHHGDLDDSQHDSCQGSLDNSIGESFFHYQSEDDNSGNSQQNSLHETSSPCHKSVPANADCELRNPNLPYSSVTSEGVIPSTLQSF
eukprot:gene4417-6048_t